MSDVVVTVPKGIWEDWIAEGDAVGEPATGEEWGFYTSGGSPKIVPGERVYVVAHGLLRGYAPLTRLVVEGRRIVFCRRGGAVAVTVPWHIQGFRGWRYRDWKREDEIAFPTWRTENVPDFNFKTPMKSSTTGGGK